QVTGVTMGTITAHSAAVSWNDNGAESYEVQYGDRNFNQGEGTSVIVSGTSTTLTGLSADENYTLYVRAICEPGVYGLWSEQVDFSTPEGSAVNTVDGGMNVSICPNPTTGTTTIALSGVNGEVQITIVDMNGRTVMSDSMSCKGECVKKMEVAGLAQGAYFVRINCENVNMVKKLVVK
ncbi:MAG: T9SS type A sorting domain-containing protein, partial [Bacteroidales bacterium]|nr:T9SS type A sorting domain-containing protein [Bacteroidales bacterium]